MDFAELKTKSKAELQELAASVGTELHQLRLKARAQQLKQVHQIKQLRRTIARVLALLAK